MLTRKIQEAAERSAGEIDALRGVARNQGVVLEKLRAWGSSVRLRLQVLNAEEARLKSHKQKCEDCNKGNDCPPSKLLARHRETALSTALSYGVINPERERYDANASGDYVPRFEPPA